jgi:hypothetical protein
MTLMTLSIMTYIVLTFITVTLTIMSPSITIKTGSHLKRHSV